jgi:prephenate dehydrogenase
VPEIKLLKEKLSEVEQLIQNGDQANLENYLTEAASIKKELG